MAKRLALAMLSVYLLSGCTYFKGSVKIDPTPFSENTTIMFGDAVSVSRPFVFKYLKGYDVPEHDKIVAAGAPLKSALVGIVYYSNQLIAINNSKLSEKRKNEELARYIAEALQRAMDDRQTGDLQLSEQEIQETLRAIRDAETFLGGIAAANPIVNAVAMAINERIDEIQGLLPTVVRGFERELGKEFGVTKANLNGLLELRTQLMGSINRLYRVQLGDRKELDLMLKENESLRQYIDDGKSPTPKQFAAAERFLLERLENLDTLVHQMDDTKAEFVTKQLELIEWQAHVDNRIRIARNAITIWAQSHRNLGAGIEVPPLIDVSKIAAELVSGAASSAF